MESWGKQQGIVSDIGKRRLLGIPETRASRECKQRMIQV